MDIGRTYGRVNSWLSGAYNTGKGAMATTALIGLGHIVLNDAVTEDVLSYVFDRFDESDMHLSELESNINKIDAATDSLSYAIGSGVGAGLETIPGLNYFSEGDSIESAARLGGYNMLNDPESVIYPVAGVVAFEQVGRRLKNATLDSFVNTLARMQRDSRNRDDDFY